MCKLSYITLFITYILSNWLTVIINATSHLYTDCTDTTQELYQCRSYPNGIFNASNICIPINLQCDGLIDCPSGDDEWNCDNYDPSDGTGFLCNQTNDCIDSKFECDGIMDCPYQEDEDSHCGECNKNTHFTCEYNGRCILLTQLCDDIIDCFDYQDENNTLCIKYNIYINNENETTTLQPQINIQSAGDNHNNYVKILDEMVDSWIFWLIIGIIILISIFIIFVCICRICTKLKNKEIYNHDPIGNNVLPNQTMETRKLVSGSNTQSIVSTHDDNVALVDI